MTQVLRIAYNKKIQEIYIHIIYKCARKEGIYIYIYIEFTLKAFTKNCNYSFYNFLTLGPTLLFERFYGKGESRKFYACSACRDRKQCAFFHWQDEKFTKAQQEFQSVRSTFY